MSIIFEQALSKTYRKLNDASSPKTISNTNYNLLIEICVTFCCEEFNKKGAFLGNFTDHGPRHTAIVLNHAMDLVDIFNGGGKPLNKREIFILAASTILHDLGMTRQLSEDQFTFNIFTNWQRIRENHTDAIQDILIWHREKELCPFNLSETNIYDNILPHLCRSHSKKNFIECISIMNSFKALEPEIRWASIAGILLLADEMDIDRSRIPDKIESDSFDYLSQAHWWKHQVIAKCYLDGNNIKIISSREEDSRLKIFKEWNLFKIKNQLKFISDNLEEGFKGPFSSIEVVLHSDDPTNLASKLATLGEHVCECALKEYQLISQGDIGIVEDLKRWIDEHIAESVSIKDSSEVFRKTIKNTNMEIIFSSMDENITKHDPLIVKDSYVWEDKNRILMEELISTFDKLLSSRKNLPYLPAIRQLYILVGAIGVGKSHFLSMLFIELLKKYASSRAMLIRCECTTNDTLLSIKQKIVYEISRQLKSLDIYESISENFRQTTSSQLKDYSFMNENECDLFCNFVGKLFNEENIKILEAKKYPYLISLFLDNTDHLQEELISNLYEWCYKTINTLSIFSIFFLRPPTFIKEQKRIQQSGFRPNIITKNVSPVCLKEILDRRLDIIFKDLKNKSFPDKVKISDSSLLNNSEFQFSDVAKSFYYVCRHLSLHNDNILNTIVNINIRLAFDMLFRILSSWIVTSDIFITWMYSRVEGEIKHWPRLLEALIVGNLNWYNPDVSPVINLIDFQHPTRIGDYFLAIHILQFLSSRKDSLTMFEEIASKFNLYGYDVTSIRNVLKKLCRLNQNKMTQKIEDYFPLVIPYENGLEAKSIGLMNGDYKANAQLKITSWGLFHINTLLYQTKYWFHILYSTLLPVSVYNNIMGNDYSTLNKHTKHNVLCLLEYLLTCENRWIKGRYTNNIGIYAIFPKIIISINKQLSKSKFDIARNLLFSFIKEENINKLQELLSTCKFNKDILSEEGESLNDVISRCKNPVISDIINKIV